MSPLLQFEVAQSILTISFCCTCKVSDEHQSAIGHYPEASEDNSAAHSFVLLSAWFEAVADLGY